ncbi:hypothetical protein TSUD_220620 [Trifolium subterraneum]|uniref:Integrase catalytic domain-containing protein n=1 Tax=Trifolium subterraneum TaxID=3900 RepID=A0A2Z6N4K3_TRISU|nr:hypothetical protein TSUD_220620 [Trifolium subterraneum]
MIRSRTSCYGVITAHNLHRFVVNPQIPLQLDSMEARAQGTNSDAYQQWVVKDQYLFTWLLSTLSENVLPRVLGCKHAHENTKKLARSSNEYLLRIKTIVNLLITVGDVVSEQEQVDAILEGLPEEFNLFVIMIYSRFDSPTVEDFEALLILQEAQFEKFKQELHAPSVSANVAHSEARSTESVTNQDLHEVGTEHYNVNPQRGRGRGKGRGRGCGRYDSNAMRPPNRPYNAGPGPRPAHSNAYMRPSAHLALPHYYPHMADMESMASTSWYPDSGASHHLTFNPSNLAYDTPYTGPEQVMMGNGQDSKQILLEGNVGSDGLYSFKPFKFLPHSSLSNTSPKSTSFSVFNNHVNCNNVISAFTLDNEFHKWHLSLGKSHRLHAPNSITVYSAPFEVLHCDFWGPAPFHSYYGYNYYITFVCTFTKYTWIYFLKAKSDALKAFTQFLAFIKTQFQANVKALQSDWCGEFRPFTDLLNSLGIQHRLTCPHTSHQNGTVERKHRQIVEMGLTLLSHATLPLKFWDHSFTQAVYLINKLPSSVIPQFHSPHHGLYKTDPDYSLIKVFGCLCFPHLRPYNKHKLQFRSSPCVYLGVSPHHKGHKCLDAQGRIYISKDVVFHEFKFPYLSMFSPDPTSTSTLHASSSYHAHIHFPLSSNVPSNPSPAQSPILPNNLTLPSTPAPSHSSPSTTVPSMPSQPPNLPSLNTVFHSPSDNSPALRPNAQPSLIPPVISDHNNHPMVTRGKTGSLKPKVFLAETEPHTVKIAMSDPRWLTAMQSEYKALLDNHTWSLVSLPPHRKAIGCKWVFRVKENPDGSVNKFKARLVAKGFLQTAGFDFTETFSPVVKPITIRILLTLVVTYKWQVQQIDVNNAFLNGVLQEEVFMQQPPGFEANDKSLVCKLHKSLYGLKQAPRAWYDRLTQALIQMGFAKSRCDPSHSQNGSSTYVLIYVYDILITGSATKLVQDVIHKLNAHFELKQMGQVDYFLGIEVHHLPFGALLLNQAKYIRDLLGKTKMTNSKPISSPMMSSCRLSKVGSDTMSDPTLYRSTVGALQYATLTRPDIAFSVNKVCQFMANPLESHWKAVKRILRYLNGTMHHGLLISPSASGPPFSLRAYSDVDWATDHDDHRSTSGSCIYFGPNLVSWGSKKQQLVARSSTEAEYRSMANTTAELLWIQSMLDELHVPYHTPTLLCDNISAVSLAHNPVLHFRTKHLELDIHFVREKVLAKQLHILYVPATGQLVDPLTKPLAPSNFASIRAKLKVFSCQKPP